MDDNGPAPGRAGLPANASGQYAVGHGRPPAEHRFQKGRSGNPGGRPRKQRAPEPQGYHGSADRRANQLLMQEAYRPVTIREGEKVIELPAIQAVFRAMGIAAVKGNRFAQKMIAELVAQTEEASRQQQQSLFETAATYKMNWEEEIAHCRERGLPIPQPVPHPDDLRINYREGTVRIAGPFYPDEKAEWDKCLDRRAAAQEEVNYSADRYKRTRKPSRKEMYLQEWHHEQLMFDIINDAMPERYKAKLENRSYREGASQAGKSAAIMAERRRKASGKKRTGIA